MTRRSVATTAVLALVALGTTSCGGLRGELVETGMASEDRSPAAEISLDTLPYSSEEGIAGHRSTRPISSSATAEPDAFRFKATELFTGAPISGSELYRSGPALIVFVSPGCVISVEEGPDLAASAEMNPDVTYVFVHTAGEQASYESFVENADLYQENAVHIDGSDLALWNRFRVEVQPSTVLVDNDGLVSITSGGLGIEGLQNAVSVVSAS